MGGCSGDDQTEIDLSRIHFVFLLFYKKFLSFESSFCLVTKLKNFGSTSAFREIRRPKAEVKSNTSRVLSYTPSLASMCTNIIITEHTILVHNFYTHSEFSIHKTNERVTYVYFCYINRCAMNEFP